MAAYSHSQLLLLLSSVCLCGFGSVYGLKTASGPAELPNPPVLRAAEPQAKDAPALAAAAGASQPRRATGWKLSEEEACKEDLTRLCPKHTWTNNLAVLECLQDHREVRRSQSHRVPHDVMLICWACRSSGFDPHRLSAWDRRTCLSVQLRTQQVSSGLEKSWCNIFVTLQKEKSTEVLFDGIMQCNVTAERDGNRFDFLKRW